MRHKTLSFLLPLFISMVASVACADEHEYVDLGLPSGTLWATCNIGASSPEDYGDYFAWGETTGYNSGKTTFTWGTYTYCNGSMTSLTKYCTQSSYGYNGFTDMLTELEPEDDAAYSNWGQGWRMPTKEQLDELKQSCTWTLTKLSGVNGYTVKGKSGNSIFLPLAGSHSNSFTGKGSIGRYWSCTLYTDGTAVPRNACYLYLVSNPSSGPNVNVTITDRCWGTSIRPVRESKGEDNIEDVFMDNGQNEMGNGIYDLSGREVTKPTKGINIVKKNDGTTRKVLVK